ncbi:phosphotransferase enzyme family protein [Streptomyces lydicus]|uniref:phosphotransferase enzyme family protein n=1 Tax=Streptomyces lydicus TaxID=47763 RepID=UPI001012B647|nr:phosphotransferase [Streptomyces lydicus]MCZ1012151.1 phosphotransferase [Streptomyces lydicus]
MTAQISAAVTLARDAFAIPAAGGVLLGGGATANQVVALTDGAGRRRWVLRGPRRDARPERLAFLLGFHQAARTRGLPVAAPRHTVDGQAWTYDAQGRPWLLLDYLPGRPLDVVTAELAELAAARLADLHRLPAQLGLTTVGPDPAWNAWLTLPEETWRACADVADGHHALLNAYRVHLDQLHEHAPELQQANSQVWGHGDFHGHNLLHHRGQITGVIDLDGVGRRPRITDLAYAALMLARTGSGDYRIKPHLLRAVLTGYQQHATAPLTPAEERTLCPAMVLSQLPDPAHLTALLRAGHDLGPALARPLAALRDLAAQRTLLVNLITESTAR